MKNRTATLGILAAALGGLVAVVLAGRGRPREAQSPAWWGEEATPPEPLMPIAGDMQAGGPAGATGHVPQSPRGDEGHAVPDLAPDATVGADHRAPAAFRPDMDAPMTATEREALRPASGPAPSLVGASTSSTGGSGG